MDKNVLKMTLVFIAGVGLGVFGGVKLAKHIYEEEYEERLNEEIDSINEGLKQLDDVDYTDEQVATMNEEFKKAKEETSAVLEIKDRPGIRTYHRLINPYNKAENEKEDLHEQLMKYEELSDEANDMHKDKPHIITLKQFSEEKDHYDKSTIYFYEDDEVLTDEGEEIIVNPNDIVGEGTLESFGQGSEDPEIVYARNDKMQIDYEIIRLSKSYATTVLGLEADDGGGR